MSIEQIPARQAAGGAVISWNPIPATGTYALQEPLDAGLYRVVTDTTQSIASASVKILGSSGYQFGSIAIRGGLGYVAVADTAASFSVNAGTFPLLIGFEKLETYALRSAPTNVSADYTSASAPYTFTASYTAPPGAASIGIFWPNGTFTNYGAASGSFSGSLVGITPTSGSTVSFIIAASDANGIFGIGASASEPFPYYLFTSSGTYTPPPGSSFADVWVAGGGGAGGGATSSYSRGGGGAAGTLVHSASVATSASVSVTIGAGGTANASGSGGTGGASSFGGVSASGGVGGAVSGSNGLNGEVGSGAGAPPNRTGGTATIGFAGGNSNYGSGGGGGMGGAGANATGASPSVTPGGSGSVVSSVTISSGGNGANRWSPTGSLVQGGANPVRGGGGGGASKATGANVAGSNGTDGIVLVKALF
jgi:hypothetical protein